MRWDFSWAVARYMGQFRLGGKSAILAVKLGTIARVGTGIKPALLGYILRWVIAFKSESLFYKER